MKDTERTLIAGNTPIRVYRAALQEIAELREAFRGEMDCQIVHDSIHYRRGWTMEFALAEGHRLIGYASLAVDGPWKDRPTLYEVYVVPERRSRAFALFDAFLATAQPTAFEVQSSDSLTTTLALTYARDITTERVVFRDHEVTRHSLPGAALHCLTALEEIRSAMAERQGGGEWQLELDGDVVARGGILFHYNVPYGDIYMSVEEAFRRRGIGSYLVQELKRLCYDLGATPAARCDPTNSASFRTLQRAGFLAYAHILTGAFRAGEATSTAPETRNSITRELSSVEEDMATSKQKAAARKNVKKAARAAKRKKTISKLPKKTRTALGKQGAKMAKKKRGG